MAVGYKPTWDLDVIFKGGSDSRELMEYMSALDKELDRLSERVNRWSVPTDSSKREELESIVSLLNKTSKMLQESSAYISCLSAQDVNDKKAKLLIGKRSEFSAKKSTILAAFDQKIVEVTDVVWEELIAQPPILNVSFVLDERRRKAKDRLPFTQEVMINDLGVDGYHGWGQMYDTIVGKMSVPISESGQTKHLSMGQAANKLSDPDRNVRKEVFEKISQAWDANAELFGETLNHLAGFRLQTYKHRGWNNVLKEPVEYNRMSEKTLYAMWNAIENNKTPFVSYLKRKAELLGVEKLSWYDLDAPISNSTKTFHYQDGAHFIMNQFQKFSPQMASFAKKAFEEQWIEAEDRPGKRPGGFCTSFPDSQQTRIFMTYSGTSSNIATLAHELGHGYHQHVMNDLDIINQSYAMNVAETASTFAEMVVADAAVKEATNKQEKIALLENKIQRSVAFFMNIHARFLFETKFYEERKQGLVSVEKLKELMVGAETEAYCGELEEYDPMFWASKLHFHITDVPFYNFPYTFGYLFSLGIYANALDGEDNFEESYQALLRDTGQMQVEDLAKKHLGIDLEELDFWEKAIQICIRDVEEFLKLTEGNTTY
ncbi:M3 family oligoendopeptidase [Aquibacillus sp. 3ASR75-11]|uniref:M3 family oligoendopeptidase n=1 Tax=Terrihalobacillus insolitus TaxID=2950438 RepID=A0A9X3WT74_9BACI|nr:M3 family oligoendopeptidase [Terrihalobacillus insolitus]MDC3412722.1 M3 family oligoendopeptidase [Terrihalobacillus insolitus]MDC3423801.1 M3 family oligoendopeptidase [Terrihalobacillus insolitus]